MRGSTASHISLWRVIASFAVGFSAFIFVGDLGPPTTVRPRLAAPPRAPSHRNQQSAESIPAVGLSKRAPLVVLAERTPKHSAKRQNMSERSKDSAALAHAQASQTRAPSLHRTMSTIHNATNAVIVPNDPTDTTIPVATVMEITPIVPTTPTPISDPAIAAAAKANADKANKAAASSCDARERAEEVEDVAKVPASAAAASSSMEASMEDLSCDDVNRALPQPTERLRFAWWKDIDPAHAHTLWSNEAVTRLIGGPWSADKIDSERLPHQHRMGRHHGVQYWPLFMRDGGDFVGCCGLRRSFGTSTTGLMDLELGFHLLEQFWGQGLAFEAATSVIAHAFGPLRVFRLRAGHHPENANSRKVLQRLGFTFTTEQYYPPTGLEHPSYILYNNPEPGSLADSALSKLPHDELALVLAAMHPEDLLNLAVVSRDVYVLVATEPSLLERLGLRYRLPPNSDRDADMDPFNLGQLRKHLRATTFDLERHPRMEPFLGFALSQGNRIVARVPPIHQYLAAAATAAAAMARARLQAGLAAGGSVVVAKAAEATVAAAATLAAC